MKSMLTSIRALSADSFLRIEGFLEREPAELQRRGVQMMSPRNFMTPSTARLATNVPLAAASDMVQPEREVMLHLLTLGDGQELLSCLCRRFSGD